MARSVLRSLLTFFVGVCFCGEVSTAADVRDISSKEISISDKSPSSSCGGFGEGGGEFGGRGARAGELGRGGARAGEFGGSGARAGELGSGGARAGELGGSGILLGEILISLRIAFSSVGELAGGEVDGNGGGVAGDFGDFSHDSVLCGD